MKKAKNRQEWINTLIGKNFDGCTINKDGEVMDEIGNYLFSLPREPIDDVAGWIDRTFDELSRNGE